MPNPFAISVRSKYALSSVAVMCPMTEIQAPVARAGEFFVSVARLPRSHPSRKIRDKMLPSRCITRSAPANSLSIIISRLSETP